MVRAHARLIAASFLLVAALTRCSSSGDAGSAQAVSTTSELTTPEVAGLDALVAAFVADSPGGVDVLFQREGEVQRAAAGVGSAGGDPLDPGQAFRVGSISKPFVAVMVLQLAEEGNIDLDATLETYLPDTTVGAAATIRQLLAHQSGIPNYTDQPAFFADLLAETSGVMTPADILGYVEELPVQSPGGFSYSNTNYVLLGQLVEQLDGGELNASLRERITEPLALSSTRFETMAEAAPDDLVPGWTALEGASKLSAYDAVVSSAWAAGALVSSTDDLALFLTALSDGSLISAASFTEMSNTGTAGYGLGLFAVSFSATQKGVGYGGSIPGYTSTMAIDPATGDTLIILTADDALVADQLALRVLSEL